MKIIEVDEELYRIIAGHTQHIGESASDILRRMLNLSPSSEPRPAGIVVSRDAGKECSVDRVRAVRELLLSDEYAAQTKAIGRFMQILSSLYSLDQADLLPLQKSCAVVPGFILPKMRQPCCCTAPTPSQKLFRVPLIGSLPTPTRVVNAPWSSRS